MMRFARTTVLAALAAMAMSSSTAATPPTGGGDQSLRVHASQTKNLRVARLSTFAIRDLLEAHGYRKIGKIKFNGFTYIVRATDRKGRPVKLYVDPSTAKVLKKIIYK